MKVIKIEIPDFTGDPMINVRSEDFPMEYTSTGTSQFRGRLVPNMHGLQCSWLENEHPETYKRLMELCDQISDATREIIKLHQ